MEQSWGQLTNRAQILDSKLDEIQISLDALTQRTFERLRVGARYDQVMNNVHALLREKEESTVDLRVVLRFTVLAENECELDDFIDYWKGRVNDIIVAEDTRPGMPSRRLRSDRVPNRICHDLSYELFVSWDGRVFPCFVSYNGELLLGDLKKESLKQIWNCEKLAHLRRLHESGKRGQISLCSTCTADQCLILSIQKGEIRRVGLPIE
jgi:radical SAM protein with 4Fe4S-binding SPASM domain